MDILGKTVFLWIMLRKKVARVTIEGNQTERTNVSSQIVSAEMNAVRKTHRTDLRSLSFAVEYIVLNTCSTELKVSNVLHV